MPVRQTTFRQNPENDHSANAGSSNNFLSKIQFRQKTSSSNDYLANDFSSKVPVRQIHI
jgi:hypothetical protein